MKLRVVHRTTYKYGEPVTTSHHEARHGRPYPWRRRECARPHVEEMPRLEPGCEHHGEDLFFTAAVEWCASRTG